MIAAFPGMFMLLLTSLTFSTALQAADGQRIKQRADAVLTLMSYMIVPDITASDLNIGSGSDDKTELSITQFGGGATMGDTFPLYLEGAMGYSRYDPQFGTMASDLRVGKWALERHRNAEYDFLDGGRLNAYGLGGSLMLDYELVSPAQDIDVELRYTGMNLQTFGSTSSAVEGSATAQNLGLYLRRRAPLFDWTLLKSPVRYVLEGAHTEYLGEQRGTLGFDSLSSVGIGIEMDSSKYPVFITRTRLVARYMFGNGTSGYGVGLALSF